MNIFLLLGAGFSRNWGGWLANEAFEYLIGCPEIIKNTHVRKLLWDYKDNGGYESALAKVQNDWKTNPTINQPHLIALQDSIKRMFDDMNTAFLKHSSLEFQKNIPTMLRTAMVRFDAIFTLNQDLLVEHLYLNENISLTTTRRWSGYQLPGLKSVASSTFPNIQSTANKDWIPTVPSSFQIDTHSQPYFKLHGSSNWKETDNSPLLIMGGNKEYEIHLHPILSWYYEKFCNYISQPNSRLLVIGYGFRDDHINRAIKQAVEAHGLEMFIIDPLGADLAWKINETRIRGSITVETPLENLFKASVIGASRRSLREIFGNDSVEHSKLMRFIEDS